MGAFSACRERNPAYIQANHDAAVGPEVGADVAAPPDVSPDAPRAAEALSEVAKDTPVGPEARPDEPLPPPLDATVDQEVVDATDARGDARDTRKPDDTADVGRGEGPRDAADVPLPADARDAPFVLADGPLDSSPVETAPVDVAALCSEGDQRDCASADNPLIGACHAGQQKCSGGAWGACAGEMLPGTEVCGNGVDDDCNGMTDEGCLADCVVVGPAGDDPSADGTAVHPFATVAAALAFAATSDGGGPRQVCVAAGTSCTEAQTYAIDTELAIPDGARLQGNYALDGTTLKYCGATLPPITVLQFTTAAGAVGFGAGVTAPTELGGFVIERFSPSSVAPGTGPIRAISVAGGKHVVVSNVFVTDAPGGQTTYGVDVEGDGQVTITGSSIGGGNGTSAAVGVFVGSGSVVLRGNCDEPARGMCATACTGNEVLGIRGRAETGADATGTSSAVYVGGNAAAATVVGNTLCGGPAGASGDALGASVATLRCEAGRCATVSGNAIAGGSGRVSVAVALSGAGLLAANEIRPGCANEEATAVVLDGSAARLENNRIVASACAAASFRGLRVVLRATGGGPDVHSNVIDPGGEGECQSTGIDISRSEVDASSAGTFRNNIVLAGACAQRFAVLEQEKATARLFENNDLYALPTSGTTATTVLFRRGATDANTAEQLNQLEGARGNLAADPKLVAYPDDLHLTAESPCIDRGTAAGAPATDGEGRTRPQGAGYDIGAYERPIP